MFCLIQVKRLCCTVLVLQLEAERKSGKIKAIDQLGRMGLCLLLSFKFVFKTFLQFLKDRVDCCTWIVAPYHYFTIIIPTFFVRYVQFVM